CSTGGCWSGMSASPAGCGSPPAPGPRPTPSWPPWRASVPAEAGSAEAGSGSAGPPRRAVVERDTAETKVRVELCVDGRGHHDITTGIGFYDHMLAQLARHGGLDLTVRTEGDLHVDAHHTVEDTALALGAALAQALGDKAGVRRFGDALVPLDE